MSKIKVMSIFGTRPEAIKMIPLIKKLEKDARFTSIVVITAQHREMLDQVLQYFNIVPDYDLDVMESNQTLTSITTKILEKLTPILVTEKPDIVLVHGDTTTTYASALAAFYQQIKIGHVEAGLRTWNKRSPYPEEANRQLTDILSDLYFAPTERSKENLEKENHSLDRIYITGNTAIDTMKYTIKEKYSHPYLPELKENRKMIVVTMHRRENLGEPMENVCRAIHRVASSYPNIEFVFPMHRNPKVREKVVKILGDLPNIHLIEPLDVVDFHNFIARSYMILTDSGGVQEEAPSLGVPVLVLRDTTERPEGVAANTLKLVGTNEENVYREIKNLIENEIDHKKMAQASNPYGDGRASERIIEAIANEFHHLNQGISGDF
ncbi:MULTISPECIES: non-hydrolyzing UDP-N-acetylglucosamine 2-epimerase [Enterococcus]|uniref:UDP-N-acetylglucosamine 2-epimerase (non-hydrolyzing) n=1 Tax=Candidatus Enterococcus mangumiae TaxID=2230878 RepID=A0ABZ2SX08_9ENTE|nr:MULTISPECIES: UDP-N-acetylglucosamine 2-epimerase (non-hydrolyzing) [unclassified Enterococcus]MBO0491457.1 UDP-N-acetylglucosamine 2-epimerase (non-hydrolyzing) [Enterococcus sp. DIV1094]MBO1301186.1 UDP-N-acetylglucosamine 2-epimerase (non-hydrolyzing) [Enterococcus sp. DIV1271a]